MKVLEYLPELRLRQFMDLNYISDNFPSDLGRKKRKRIYSTVHASFTAYMPESLLNQFVTVHRQGQR